MAEPKKSRFQVKYNIRAGGAADLYYIELAKALDIDPEKTWVSMNYDGSQVVEAADINAARSFMEDDLQKRIDNGLKFHKGTVACSFGYNITQIYNIYLYEIIERRLSEKWHGRSMVSHREFSSFDVDVAPMLASVGQKFRSNS